MPKSLCRCSFAASLVMQLVLILALVLALLLSILPSGTGSLPNRLASGAAQRKERMGGTERCIHHYIEVGAS